MKFYTDSKGRRRPITARVSARKHERSEAICNACQQGYHDLHIPFWDSKLKQEFHCECEECNKHCEECDQPFASKESLMFHKRLWDAWDNSPAAILFKENNAICPMCGKTTGSHYWNEYSHCANLINKDYINSLPEEDLKKFVRQKEE